MGRMPRPGIPYIGCCRYSVRLLARQRGRQDPGMRVPGKAAVVLLYARGDTLYGVVRYSVDPLGVGILAILDSGRSFAPPYFLLLTSPVGLVLRGFPYNGPRCIFENTDKLTNRGAIAIFHFPL